MGQSSVHHPEGRRASVRSHFGRTVQKKSPSTQSVHPEREQPADAFVHAPRSRRVVIGLFSPQQPLSSVNFLYELDKITQDVLMVRLLFWPVGFACANMGVLT